MGIVQKPAVHLYWSQNPLLKASVYNVVMPRNRFQIIHAFLHFADNTYYDPTMERTAKFQAIHSQQAFSVWD